MVQVRREIECLDQGLHSKGEVTIQTVTLLIPEDEVLESDHVIAQDEDKE